MGFKRGPNVVTDGLVMYLDVGNVKSFRGEPTFNKISGDFDTTFDSFSDGDNAGFLNQLGSGNYLGVSSFISYKGLKSLRINRGSGGTGRVYRTFSVSTGEFSSISAWVYSDVAGPFIALEYFGGDYNWGVAYNNNIHTGSGWELIWCRTVGGATSPTTGYYFLHPSVNNFDTYWDNIQVENKQYNTSYVNGTRGTTVLSGGGVKDLSGFNNNGELFNGPMYNPSNNGMLTFDGVNDYIRANITETQITTVDVWFYTPIQITSGAMSIGYGGLGNYGTSGVINQYDGFIFGDWTGGAANETIGYYQHNPPGFIYIREVIPAGYHNIVMNYNITDATYDFFLNGNKVTRYTAAQGIVSLISTDVVVLGCTGDPETVGSPYYGSCGIMNVKVYNRVLTEPEIKQNYNATKQRFAI
jgi:hypothetical protein